MKQKQFFAQLLPLVCAMLLALGLNSELLAQVGVNTQHNDNARTGLNTNETLLTLVTVNPNYFGKLFSQPVDGPVYAQPLYLPNVSITNKGTHNVVFVATQHDSVYAFDADNKQDSNSNALWQTSFINPGAGITAVPTADVGPDCRTFVGEIGIVGTPVIDEASSTLYVVARTKEPISPTNNSSFIQVHRLHALDVGSGTERSNSPVVIDAAVPGSGEGNSGGIVGFNQIKEMQRPGLLLAGGIVYIAFASYCDNSPYHGWIIGYDAHTLARVSVFNTTPGGSHGGIWMAGAGLAADAQGAIYCITGDGTFDSSLNPTNFGDSFLKLQGTNLAVLDYFAPHDQADLFLSDNDLGSGGAVLLPDEVGSSTHPHLLVGAGKDGRLFLLDRDNMGHFNLVNDNQIVQEFPFYSSQQFPPHFFGSSAYFAKRLYIQGVGEVLKAFAFTNGLLDPVPVSQNTEIIGFRGSIPSITANGLSNGIVWQIAYTPTPFVSTLRAYNAENLSQKLFDSYLTMSTNSSEQLSFVKFVVPTIVNGKAYVGCNESVAVFGLRPIIISIARDPVSGIVDLVFVSPSAGATFVQVSEDLIHWTDVGQGTAIGNGTFKGTDSQASGRPTRFYRLH